MSSFMLFSICTTYCTLSRENIDIKISLHRVEVFLISGEDEGVVRLSLDAQRHAEHFIPIFIAPRLYRRKVAAVDPHIQCQQTAGVGDKGTVPSILLNTTCFAVSLRICGAVIGALGATVFVTSVVTMRYSRVLDEHIFDILY